MKKAILAIVISLVGSLGIVVGTTVSAQASSTCQIKPSSYDEEKLWIEASRRYVKVWNEQAFYHCVNDQTGNRWIEPYFREFGYNVTKQDGSDANLTCKPLPVWLQGVRFNFYYSDKAGHSINPGTVTLNCAEDGNVTHVSIMDRANNDRLLNCGGAPKWVADITVAIAASQDEHTTLAGTMWGFIGPFPTANCP